MRRFAFVIVLLSFKTISAETDTLRAKVDSLFLRASSGQLKFRELNEPSKKALREMPEAIPYLVEKLTLRDARERRTLIDILGKMPEAVMPVAEATTNANRDVVKIACEILGELKDSRATPHLVKVLDHPDILARGYAAVALGKCGGRGVKEGLLKALQDSVNFVRTQAAAGLGFLKDKTTLSKLIDVLQDEYYGVRFAAVSSLAKFDSTAVPYLLKSLHSEVPMVRQLSAEALGKIRSRAAVPRLSRMLKSKLWSDRLTAIEALSQIDTPAARRILSSHREGELLVKARQEELLNR
ncbi:MAG TPA: HEAT repeat domain-containing protein [Verrucomicrobiae bacterium]|nr:HEAT repeat domain-containing protein [Verrucomicrobiae bacterium]